MTIDRTFALTISFGGWICVVPFVVLLAAVIGVSLLLDANRREAEARADFQFESDLQREIARSKASTWASTWDAPTVPASVIASIWVGRFVRSTPPVGAKRDYMSSIRSFNWNYRREPPYIVATALLSLRDAGLITMFLEPARKHFDSFHRVRVARTDMAVSGAMPVIEGDLLTACEAFAEKRFRKTTTPAATQVVTEWIHQTQNDPFKWVLEVAIGQSRQLGLCEPAIKRQTRFGTRGGDRPVYSVEHLAACEAQVAACVSRWRQFATEETDLQQRLLTEVSFGILGRTTRSAGG